VYDTGRYPSYCAGYPPFYDENPFGIYQKILAGKIEYPRHFDVHAKDLVRKLLSPDRSKRIGNLKNGAEDIKKHKYASHRIASHRIDSANHTADTAGPPLLRPQDRPDHSTFMC
jgi:hypothetical protein